MLQVDINQCPHHPHVRIAGLALTPRSPVKVHALHVKLGNTWLPQVKLYVRHVRLVRCNPLNNKPHVMHVPRANLWQPLDKLHVPHVLLENMPHAMVPPPVMSVELVPSKHKRVLLNVMLVWQAQVVLD